jgi:hypothetical protein
MHSSYYNIYIVRMPSGRAYVALRSECESAPWPMHAGPHARTYIIGPTRTWTVRCVTASRKRTHPSKDDPAKPWQRLSLAATVRATAAVLGKELSFLGRTGQPECQSLVVDVACAMAGEHDVIECREAGSVPLVLHVL